MKKITGKDLILYIMQNNLEQEPIYSDNGILVGFMTVEDAAEKFKVPESTVLTWINDDLLEGVLSNGNVIIPINAVDPREALKCQI